MTLQTMDDDERALHDIVAADEAHKSLARQVVTGLGGMIGLLAIGLLVLLVVLWKAP